MKRYLGVAAVATAMLCVPASAVGADLDVYTISATPQQATTLAQEGVDVAAQRPNALGGVDLDLVLSKEEVAKLSGKGLKPALKRVPSGETVMQFSARQAADGYQVYRSWDQPGGIRDELYEVARDNPDLVKLVVLGRTWQGREIIALRVTEHARKGRDGEKPAVLYSATQHAREWMATEMNRRLLHWYIDQYRAKNKEVRGVLKDSELWFATVLNPDGYQYTFDAERLWRKNLRDNDGNGQSNLGDGVDPNRNFDNHWNYDEEGSSSNPSSDTYRGPSPASEPETKAAQGILKRVGFEFLVNYHTYGPWLIYPEGWQTSTATEDDPIYFALSGNRERPAIPGFVPGISADVLYVTNGEMDGYAQDAAGTIGWTPELNEGCEGCGFVFPDDEALVQAEFEKGIPFALSVAKSAETPAEPVSALGIQTKPFYLKSDDPYKDGLPTANFTFDVSYGDPQPVQVLAKRALGRVELKYRINGGRAQSADTSEVRGGNRHEVAGTHRWYHVVRGHVRGARKGDSVQVWFEAKKAKSDSFTYKQAEKSHNRVLIVANEDYTGTSPVQNATAPKYVSYYQDALRRNLLGSDVYDVDAHGRKSPTYLGVLSHYDAVVWYTGDDIITRDAGWPAGTASRSANDLTLHMREYMNAGGGVLYTGKNVGTQYTGAYRFDPKPGAVAPCLDTAPGRCFLLQGSPQSDLVNDVIEYWFGARMVNNGAGVNEETGAPYPVTGIDTPFTWFGALSWSFGGESANNQDTANSYIPISAILDPGTYPQFSSVASSRYDRPGGPFAPHTGSYYVYSNIADISYKRLTRTITVPASGGKLSFWTSYNTEPDWDFLFVEAHTVGQDNWTTLADENGHTSNVTGSSCAAGWRDLHPQLDHYQTWDGNTTCTATGSTGVWNAGTGDSGGWEQWSVDLAQFAGQQIEISLTYASDWGTQGLGVFFDDITTPDGVTESFESGLGAWTVPGAPEGSGANTNDFERITAEGFPEGASITASNSILMGFGLEGVDGAAKRAQIMGRAMLYLLTRR